ncbi:hypothetical protein VSR34_27780 [Paraburkholderia sp. JHI2823]|uniref:hypothetical protein n=1 Tax=Paraburkholderia sp. JHI2823 TaxID=3112960 RepID=UPI00317733F8
MGSDFRLIAAPHGEGLDRAKSVRGERIAERKKAEAETRRTERAMAEPETTDKHDVSATDTPPAIATPRKLAAGVRIGLLELQRDIGRARWACHCDCGKQTVLHATALRGSRQSSCGCASRRPAVETDPPRQPEHGAPKPRRTSTIATGMRRGHLTALRHVRETKWRWLCVCGSVSTIDAATVVARKIRHCGCGGKKRADVVTKTADEQLRGFYASMPIVLLGPL